MNPTDARSYRDPAPPSHEPRWNPHAVRAFALAAASCVLIPAAVTLSIVLFRSERDTWFVLISAASIASMVAALMGIRRGWRVRDEGPSSGTHERGLGLAAAAVPVGIVGMLFSLFGLFLAWVSTLTFSRGRQLRSHGRVLLAPVAPASGWTTQSLSAEVDANVRSAVAAQWRENGRTEHASVAAFARVTLDLMALGAPASLLSAAGRDALDEVRHAELCFSLARSIDGQTASPGPFPEASATRARSSVRSVALAQLAVDSLVDGALHEGVSARVIAKLAKRCEDDATREVLKELAADEGRHAAHGWDVVLWCLAEGGAPVSSALLGALDGLPPTMRSPLPEGAADGSWERWGLHGHALDADEYARTLTDLRARVQKACA